MTNLADLTWPDLEPALLAVPLGATEQHGPHLPFTVDTEIAVALCERLAEQRPVLVAPPVAYGSSGEHADFPGTLSIGQRAVELLILELVRSADAYAGVVLISAHGGNADPLNRALRTLHAESRRAIAWSPPGRPDDTHAGLAETSVMLALRPAGVRLDLAERGTTTPLPDILPTLREKGLAAVTPNGVLGDPRGATAAEGDRLLTSWTRALTATVDAWTCENTERGG